MTIIATIIALACFAVSFTCVIIWNIVYPRILGNLRVAVPPILSKPRD